MTEQPNPLIVAPEHEDAQPLNWEGAGAASSWADLNAALGAEHVDPAQVAYTAMGAGLDTLGAVASPFDSLLSAGLGWLIEHVWWLHEPLDALAGDPTQITAQAQTWHNVGGELRAVAAEYRRSAAALPGWDGAANDAYRAAIDRYGAALGQTAGNATQLADLILGTGAAVGTVRALVRDKIVEFFVEVTKYIAAWLALSAVTAGAGLGAATLQVVIGALQLAEDIRRQISRLLDALAAAGGTAEQLSDVIRQTAAQVKAAVPQVRAAAGASVESADELKAGELIETGKQMAAADQNQRQWGGQAG